MGTAGQTAIIANASRLLKDAKLLLDHRRYASSFALSVLALEEIGKVVLDLWGWPEAAQNPNKRLSAHVKKQAAVSSLLFAEPVTKEWSDLVNREAPSEALVEHCGSVDVSRRTGAFSLDGGDWCGRQDEAAFALSR